MKLFIVIVFGLLSANLAFALSQSATCIASPSNEALALSLKLIPGTSTYDSEVKFKASSFVFRVMSRSSGLTIGTNIGDTVIAADSQNSTSGTTLALGSQSNVTDFIKVTCKLN